MGEGRLTVSSTLCDYTPPDLISCIVTDFRILMPSAVNEELMEIFSNPRPISMKSKAELD